MKNNKAKWHFWISNGGAGYTEVENLRRAKISDIYGSENDAIYEEIDEFLREIENEREEEELEIVNMDDNYDSE
ncbi:21962_t:CDS:2 [Rhizophagus irregularis]|nr:21962_t:CDS:2 [Rhizophagus irregularis]